MKSGWQHDTGPGDFVAKGRGLLFLLLLQVRFYRLLKRHRFLFVPELLQLYRHQPGPSMFLAVYVLDDSDNAEFFLHRSGLIVPRYRDLVDRLGRSFFP